MENNTEMYNRNQNAILLMDARKIELADKAFLDNYSDYPCLISAVNYANYLMDEHCSTAKRSIISNSFRKRKIKQLLSMNENMMDAESIYHTECVRGHFYYNEFQLDKAKMHYERALHLEPNSIEASAMVAWILFLMNEYGESLVCLDKLSMLLQLGDDFRENMDILFDNCPFVLFPYYQIRVIALYHVGLSKSAYDLLDQLCANALSSNEALFPATDLVMMCLHLHHHRHLDQLVNKIAVDSYTYSDEEIDQTIFCLMKEVNSHGERRIFTRLLWRKTTYSSKLWHLLQFLLLGKTYKVFRQVHAVRKECHFIGCPTHNPKLK